MPEEIADATSIDVVLTPAGHLRIESLSAEIPGRLGGVCYAVDSLELFRRFYAEYPELISDALRRKSYSESVAPRRFPNR
jgi:hypothetical protein